MRDDLANWSSIMGLLPAVCSEQSQSWLFWMVLLPVIPASRWAWRRWAQPGVRVETTITRGQQHAVSGTSRPIPREFKTESIPIYRYVGPNSELRINEKRALNV